MKNGITHYHHGVIWEEENGVSQGYRVKDTLYISGQTAMNTDGRPEHDGDIAAQLALAVDNLEAVLAEALDSESSFGVWGGLTERERRALLRQHPEVTSWREVLAPERTAAEAS